MTQSISVFHLKVQRVEQTCLFELSWGKQGQQLNATLPFPKTLSTLYQEWNSVYLRFYNSELRGRVAATGNLAPLPVDWHVKLVQAEANLLYEFHQWLRQAELFEIHSRIVQAAVDLERERGGESATGRSPGERCSSPSIEVFLACHPIDIARLPWEAWEMGTEFAARGKIRFVRMPMNIPKTPKASRNRRRARILAVLGDDTGLDFQAEKEAVRSLSSIADIQFVGWQPGKDIEALKAEIVKAISDEQGWDVLFFAGHSNETALGGGELAIAPNVSLLISELAQSLTIAKERGLQFALFNSCKGLSIANALINLGLSQVAVMREPIHNRVAEEFLVQFLQRLAEYKDVHESLLAACQYLKLEKHLTYPSAYLIPSLFRHPNAELFCLKPSGFKDWLKDCLERLLPTKTEAIALGTLAIASCLLPIQNVLLEQRVLTQAVYRQQTAQVKSTSKPPVFLINIDNQSIKSVSSLSQMDRDYLARLVDKLTTLNAKVIGIDYLLDLPQGKNDYKLAQSVKTARQKQGTWFVFSAYQNDGNESVGVIPEIATLDESLQGDVNLFNWHNKPNYMKLVPEKDSSSRNLPFSYLLALAHQLNIEKTLPGTSPPSLLPEQGSLQAALMPLRHFSLSATAATPGTSPMQPRSPQEDLLSQVIAHVHNTTKQDYKTLFSTRSQLHPITDFSYAFKQMWLHPIIDFSLPPEQIYQRFTARQFLEIAANSSQLKNLEKQVVIIAPGVYGEKLGTPLDGDSFLSPSAVSYWRKQQNPPDSRRLLTGGEIHAYMLHHFLNHRQVVPIPDLWMIGVAVLLGKGTALALGQQRSRQKRWQWWVVLTGVTAVYGLASLQIYISAAVLFPWLLPSVTIWIYALPNFLRKKPHA
jgi:hypothetical protein